MNFLPERYLNKIKIRKFISYIIAEAAVIFFVSSVVYFGLVIARGMMESRIADYHESMSDEKFILSDALAADIKRMQAQDGNTGILVVDETNSGIEVLADIDDCIPEDVSVMSIVSDKEAGMATLTALSEDEGITKLLTNLSALGAYDINILSITKDGQGSCEYVMSIVWGEYLW